MLEHRQATDGRWCIASSLGSQFYGFYSRAGTCQSSAFYSHKIAVIIGLLFHAPPHEEEPQALLRRGRERPLRDFPPGAPLRREGVFVAQAAGPRRLGMVVVAPPDSTNARKLAESGSCRGLLVVSQKGVSSHITCMWILVCV